MWRGILGLAFLWTVGGDFTIKEPWHVLNIDSHRLNLSLTSSSLTVAQKLCPELKEYELEDCIALVMQSHRTIRQSYLDTMATEIGLRSMEFSRLLAYSYAIESCPDDDESPLDICFFGEVSPLVLIFTLLSCERYHLKIFNVFDTESELALIFLRQLYPNRSIQWITGHYTTYFQPPFFSPNCHVIHLTAQNAEQYNHMKYLPIPQSLPKKTATFPCDGQGLIIFQSQVQNGYDSSLARGHLSRLYLAHDGDVDWRVHIITTDVSKHLSTMDSEGFIYRLFQRYTDSNTSRIDIACPRSKLTRPTSQDSTNICPHVVVTYCNRVFSETARGVIQAIARSLPHIRAVVWPDLNLALLNVTCPSPFQIAIAPHEETPLLERYIVFQMEQTWSDYMEDQRFQTILKQAASVWTFSRQQYQLLAQIGVPLINLKNLPLYTDRRYSEYTFQLLQSGVLHSAPKTVDVLFFGSTSPRRHKFLKEMQEFASQNQFRLGGILGGAEINLLRSNRDNIVRSSKIVINVHTQETSALEVHRLNYLLSMGACIISERSSDPEMDDLYASGVFFVTLDEIPSAILTLLGDDSRRMIASEAALNLSRAILDTTEPLRDALAPFLP